MHSSLPAPGLRVCPNNLGWRQAASIRDCSGGWMYRSIQLDRIHPKELRVMDRFS